jgi:hypothetical protein
MIVLSEDKGAMSPRQLPISIGTSEQMRFTPAAADQSSMTASYTQKRSPGDAGAFEFGS